MFVFTQTAIDSFARANENPLSGGGNWNASATGNPLQIVSDLVEAAHGSDAFSFQLYSGGLTWSNDQYSEVTVTTVANSSGFLSPCIRASTAATETFYTASIQGPLSATTTVFLQKFIANVATVLATLSVALQSGDKLRIAVAGQTLALYVNGSLISGSTVSDSSIASGLPGIIVLAAAIADVQVGGWSGGTTTAVISGSVGVGGAGATITLSGASSASTTADGSGNYSFTGLLTGTYIVTPGLTGKAFSPTNQTETITTASISGVNFTEFTPSKSGSNSTSVMGAGGLFGVGNITDIESPKTPEIGTDFGTEIRK